MSDHVLAVGTYGAQKVAHPRTHRRVSAHKMGYSSAAAEVLMTICPNVEEVSSARASYRYIRLDGAASHHGYLLIKVSAEGLAQAEQITRAAHRAGIFLWRDGKWWTLPTLEEPDYAEPGYQTAPRFDPASYLAYSAEHREREAAVSGIQVERTQRSAGETPWWWFTGDTYPHRDLLKQNGCRWSKKRRAWYFIGGTLPSAVQTLIEIRTATSSETQDDPCSVEEAAAILGLAVKPSSIPATTVTSIQRETDPAIRTDTTSPIESNNSQTEDAPAIRVITPTAFPTDGEPLDDIQTAIQQLKAIYPATPPAADHQAQNGRLMQIGQAYCGELTGSITGQVFCYGYAVHEGVCVYLNMGGPRGGVEAIRARLSKGEIVTLVPEDAPAIELTAGEGNSGMYRDFLHTIPEARFTSLILLHDWLVNPNYGGDATTFILRTSDEQAKAKLKHHVEQLVSLPVFDVWTDFLWSAGQAAMLVRLARSGGSIDLLTVTLNATAWTRLITSGVEQRVIALPDNT